MATKKTNQPVAAASGQQDDMALAEAQIERTARAAAKAAGAASPPLLRAAAAPNLVTELNNIDFRTMIGGPLQAAVDAQIASSLASIDFINKVGFTAPDSSGKRDLVMVDFSHTRKGVKDDGTPDDTEVNVKVPLLAMVQIPSLRIEHVIIAFNAKLNSVQSENVSDKLGITAEIGGGFGPVNFKVSASYQRQSSSGLEVKKEYSLDVNVKAVQDEIPAGLEKIFGLLAA